MDRTNKRIIEIDILRGIAVLFMIIDHFIYDIFAVMPMIFKDFPTANTWSEKIYDFSKKYWHWDFRYYFRFVIVFIFLGIVGICASFSKSSIKRGIKLMGVALVLSIGTLIASIIFEDKDMLITFGTLHCIALSLILVGFLLKYINNRWFYFGLGIIMVGIGIYFEHNVNYVSFYDGDFINIFWKQILGIVECGGDTMGFLLNGGQVVFGVFLGKTFYQNRVSILNKEYSNNVVTYIGRNSLVVYFLHQLLIPVVLSIILVIAGFSFA